jgi:hypothetical protein
MDTTAFNFTQKANSASIAQKEPIKYNYRLKDIRIGSPEKLLR